MLRKLLIALALWFAPLGQASALCIYRGVDNARTSLDQEYRDARWVVRARVMAADTRWHEGEGSTLYRLALVRGYKGALPRRFEFFTERNSGGFYMDNDAGQPEVGSEYLLFLVADPQARSPGATRATRVNYNCGQSRPWRQVTARDARRLQTLARQRWYAGSGVQFSVTRERIRQIEAKALRKLKHPRRSRNMRSFLDQ